LCAVKPFGEQANLMLMQAYYRHWGMKTTFKKQEDLRRGVKVYHIGYRHF